jgi:pyruvate kinase
MDIIASIGPTLETVDDIIRAVTSGANTFRIPLGYRFRDHVNLIKFIKIAEKSLGVKLFILLDLPSSRPRINGQCELEINKGDLFSLIPSSNTEKNTNSDYRSILIDNFNYIYNNTTVGNQILFLDGKITTTIVKINKNCIKMKCSYGNGTLKEGNSLTLKNRNEPYQLVVEGDLNIIEKLNQHDFFIDYIAFSFAETREQLNTAKNKILELFPNTSPQFIAKIETKEAVYCLKDISSVVDGIMVARGDLAVHLDEPSFVAEAQDEIVKLCNEKGLYSIIATELLENFVDTGIMSRPEISGLSLATSQLPSALQFGKETVYSERPIEAIRVLRRFIDYELFRQEMSKISLPSKNKLLRKANKPFIIAVEGANGVGKTTLCHALSKHFNSQYRFGVPDVLVEKKLKKKMIMDAHWYSSSLYFIAGAIEQLLECQKLEENIVILDRSVWSTLSVHASDSPQKLKKIIDVVYLVPELKIEPDITIILRATYKTCRSRIKNKSENEQELDELVNSKKFYQRENQFYNWLTFQRDKIINIEVNDMERDEIFRKTVQIIMEAHDKINHK